FQAPTEAAWPAIWVAPTTLTGPFGSRGLPSIALHRPGTLPGSCLRDVPMALNILPVNENVSPIPRTGPYVTLSGVPGGAASVTPSAQVSAGLAFGSSSGVRSARTRVTGLVTTSLPCCQVIVTVVVDDPVYGWLRMVRTNSP